MNSKQHRFQENVVRATFRRRTRRRSVLRSNIFEVMNKRKICFHFISGFLRTFNSAIKVDPVYFLSVTLLSSLHKLVYLIFIIKSLIVPVSMNLCHLKNKKAEAE